MSLESRIERAFAARSLPSDVVPSGTFASAEVQDALWFRGRPWTSIDWDGWTQHRDAIYAFAPEAFAYYLPSILKLSAERPGEWFFPADGLLNVLDRSPTVEYWDTFLTSRFIGLTLSEYNVIQEWLLMLSGY